MVACQGNERPKSLPQTILITKELRNFAAITTFPVLQLEHLQKSNRENHK